ncbi:uncharacterized protein [Lolium perenne]|uniref:uncharacterized protein n=1 Tax=Lolium perenne TaxID=4522 RepID=UPI003A99B3B4
MEDRDLAFLLEKSPVLEVLVIVGSNPGVRLRLVSHSLRRIQLIFTYLEDINVVDAPLLEKILHWSTSGGYRPNLRRVSNTAIVAGTKDRIVPSVQILAIELQFGSLGALKKVPAYLRSFPNLETLHVQSRTAKEPTRKVNLKFLQEGGPIKCVMQTMKKVFFYEFQGSKSEVAFLKFIAERAQVLEKMVVVVARKCFSSGDDLNAKLKPLTSAKWSRHDCTMNKNCRRDVLVPGTEHTTLAV